MTKKSESTKQAALDLTVYPAEQQGTGSFDNGRITEIKPIGFPGDKSAVSRVGPLFYWAWASSHGEAKIALHPHRGFEILSYVLAGELGHYDTLGTRSRVKTGGAQLMQTGSGISHEEKTFGPGGEFFQIWFEPNLRLALPRPPQYHELPNEQFPVTEQDGITIKSILGPAAPVTIEADVTMSDVTIQPGASYSVDLSDGRSLAVMIVSGGGQVTDADDQSTFLHATDFVVAHANQTARVSFQASADEVLRFVCIEVPTTVSYPLLNE